MGYIGSNCTHLDKLIRDLENQHTQEIKSITTTVSEAFNLTNN